MNQSDSTIVNDVNPPAPAPEEIRRELEHVVASPSLQASEKRREFLRFIVEETLAGRSGNLKGYTIAHTVFNRDESFDPQTDPVVRVEARRLRRDLDSYYMNGGNLDRVRISIPKGGYVPHFEKLVPNKHPAVDRNAADTSNGSRPGIETHSRPQPANTPARTVSLRRFGVVALLVAVVVAFSTWKLATPTTPPAERMVNEPSVLVLPFEALGASENGRHLAAGISEELISDLMRFPGLKLYAPLTQVEAENLLKSPGRMPPAATYVVSGSVLEDGKTVHVTARMTFVETDMVLWTQTYDETMNPDALIHLQRDLSGEIAAALGQPYGSMQADLQARVGTPAVSNMQSYLCVLRAYQYRRGFWPEQYAPILDCLEKAVADDPEYSDAWAMLGWLHLDAGRYEYHGPDRIQQEYDLALAAANHAVKLEPNNTLALKALSSIRFYRGEYEESERLARQAMELNPNDPDTLAQLGWRLAIRGRFEEGLPLLKRAIERTVNPPGWYFHLLAIDRMMNGDYAEMLSFARRATTDDSEAGYAMIAIASAALGDREGTRQALARANAFQLLMSNPAGFFRQNGATDEVAEAFAAELARAERFAANPDG